MLAGYITGRETGRGILPGYRPLMIKKKLITLIIVITLSIPVSVFSTAEITRSFRSSGISSLTGRDRFLYNVSLDDIQYRYLQQAKSEGEADNWEKAYRIVRDLHIPEARPVLIKSLYKLEQYEELQEYVDNMPKKDLISLFSQVAEYYLLASIKLQRYDELNDIFVLQRRFYPELTADLYKQIIYSLISSGDYNQVIEMTDIFPSDIYLEGEKNYLLGIAHYYLGFYSTAKGFFHNISGENIFRQLSEKYLSVISYYTGSPEDYPYKLPGLGDDVKFNRALAFLRAGRIDEANSIALTIEDRDKRNLIDLFVAWESGHFRTAAAHLDSFEDFDPTGYSLTTLIKAESYYHSGRYREAEQLFKLYNSFDDADTLYANHSLAYCFKGFFRFNSTAYYWIKNLSGEKAFYDSLAAYNLSLLYTHTENYHSANRYYRYYIDRYDIPQNDTRFIEAYLNTLHNLSRYSQFISIFNRYGSILPPEIRKEKLIVIADYYEGLNNLKEAIGYLEKALETEPDDKLRLRTEKMKFTLGEYKDSEDFILSLISKYPQSSFRKSLSLDLAKFYLSQRRFAQAADFIDSLLYGESPSDSLHIPIKGRYADSLRFYKGLALKEKGNIKQAKDMFVNLYSELNTPSLKRPVFDALTDVFSILDGEYAAAYLDSLIISEEDLEMRKDYLLILAEVYERRSLYGQANRIYLALLSGYSEEDTLFYSIPPGIEKKEAEYDSLWWYDEKYHVYEQDSLLYVQDTMISGMTYRPDPEILHRLAVNEIRMRNYTQALEYLDMMKEYNQGLNEEALFLSYLAHYSMDRSVEAIEILLDIYYDYPDSRKRFDIVINLIERLMENEQDIYAWFFLQEYYSTATQAERWSLDRYRDTLKPKLQSDTLAVENVLKPILARGIDFRQIYSDSLLVKDGEEWVSPLLQEE